MILSIHSIFSLFVLCYLHQILSFTFNFKTNSIFSSTQLYKSKNDLDVDKKQILRDLLHELLSSGDDLSSLLDSNNNEADEYAIEQAKQTSLLNSVVRIYCTHSHPNFGMPWQRQKQDFSTSTGFVLPNKRILTNAHAVEYGSLIQIKKRQSERKFVASVTAVGHECDLAILTVDDDSFWADLEPLPFGHLPDLFEDVSVIGRS